ncbi:GTP cyclohydrolase I FolE2 [Rhodobacteraceae bacterium CCMM004]|nr:GTP cyclohydrolase I FolE2 [Rhodobacteraceae bacterium CCMM004]
MNVHSKDLTAAPDAETAAEALATLRRWAASADPAEVAALGPEAAGLVPGAAPAAYPVLDRAYPEGFVADAAYRATLPDLQNGPASLIAGARRRIEHVGISNFRLPIRYALRGGETVTLETSVTGTVSLEAEKKGINMSRIMRSFYVSAEETTGFAVMERTLDAYLADLDSLDARLAMRVSLPLRQQSLRSGLSGWQYYDMTLEVVETAGRRLRLLHLDYVYSSTCPCSLELSEHARRTRGQLATPHSQRSVARLSMALDPAAPEMALEDAVDLARGAVVTETQVMVKREDEQAFAELNAANPVFVEDAARLFAAALDADARVGDFCVVASHQESLHSHDAVAVLTQGDTFVSESLDPALFAGLYHTG